jgi:outer membrane protein
VALLVAPPASADTKIGYVNMQRALETCAAGQQATKKLSELWEKSKTDIQSTKDKLDAITTEIDKQSMLWNDKTRRDKEDEKRRLERDYQRLLKDTQDELKGKEAEFSETITRDLFRIIEEIGKKEDFTVILEKKASAIMYAPASIELTDRIIKLYDAQKQ